MCGWPVDESMKNRSSTLDCSAKTPAGSVSAGSKAMQPTAITVLMLVALICYHPDMTKEVTLRQAGGSGSATLPKDMADRLRLEARDRVLAGETDPGILLTPYHPDAQR